MTTTTAPSSIPDEWTRDLTTRDERYAAGKARRIETPRSSHAEWTPDRERPDPISMLEASNKTRLEHLVPIRFGRMSLSAFAFYRGTADIMAYDLAKTPVSGIQAQLCGDAHLSNFGVFASPERRQVFDVNDFDETLAGPWEWDVKRLAASVVIGGRQNGYTGKDNLDTDQWRAMVKEYLTSLPEERRVIIMQYRSVDIAQKVVGVGSVGTRCAVVLALGGAEGDDPLFMQIKEAGASVLESYLGASPYANHGERVVVGQRMMQAASDILLGWMTYNGRDYYARQLRDMKFSAEVETMDPVLFTAYVELCAATLARAHARTSDPAQISGYLGNKDVFDQAIASFAEVYADQTERDHAALLTAIKEGRVQAQTGV